MGIIYGYANPKGKILYIGQTVNLEQRHNKHFKHDPYNEKVLEYNYPLSRGIRKHGEKYYSLVILEENIDNCLLNDKEMFYISSVHVTACCGAYFKSLSKYTRGPVAPRCP